MFPTFLDDTYERISCVLKTDTAGIKFYDKASIYFIAEKLHVMSDMWLIT